MFSNAIKVKYALMFNVLIERGYVWNIVKLIIRKIIIDRISLSRIYISNLISFYIYRNWFLEKCTLSGTIRKTKHSTSISQQRLRPPRDTHTHKNISIWYRNKVWKCNNSFYVFLRCVTYVHFSELDLYEEKQILE